MLLSFFTQCICKISTKSFMNLQSIQATQCAVYIHRYNRCATQVNYRSHFRKVFQNTSEISPPWRVLFFGTDEFSLESLDMLCNELRAGNLINRLDVVTSKKSKSNPVWQFAVKQNLVVHNWPVRLTKGEFDIGLVVSFGHLIPEHIIESFPLGMLNVHASLLPRWRGAAPIIYAILNGDSETGVTIMQIKPHKFDVGGILRQSRYPISPNDTMVSVSAGLAQLGSRELLECVRDLPHCLENAQSQPEEGITHAPKVTSGLAVVSWQDTDAARVYNLSRALTGLYPLSTTWNGLSVKLYDASIVSEPAEVEKGAWKPGRVEYHKRTKLLRVKCCDGRWVAFKVVGIAGKKPMTPLDFYNGYLSKRTKDDRYFQ